MSGAAAIAIAYLLGCIPFGYLLVKQTTGRDVRSSGSGNIGATNVFRTAGRGVGLLTLLLDALKAFAAVWIAGKLTAGSELFMSGAAVAVMLGHAFPVFLRFQGGKAVASFIGAFAYLTPPAFIAVTVVFVVAVWRTKFISMGSILGAVCFPLAVWIIMRPHWPVVLASVFASALILWRHRANIVRLHNGTENVFSLRKSRV